MQTSHSAISAPERYDAATIAFHWATAVLVALLWVIGQTADFFPKGPWRSGAWSIHVVVGLATFVVVIGRLSWRSAYGLPLSPAHTGALHVLTRSIHHLLYALLVAVLVTGVLNAAYRGIRIFDVLSFPKFGTGDRATRRSINGWHELSANAVVIVAALHAAAALVHHYLWRDDVLRRMGRRGGQAGRSK